MMCYCWGIDWFDWVLFELCYYFDVYDVYGSVYFGLVLGFIDWVLLLYCEYKCVCYYVIINYYVEFDGDVVYVESYYILMSIDVVLLYYLLVMGCYVDCLEKCEGCWVIVDWVCLVEISLLVVLVEIV